MNLSDRSAKSGEKILLIPDRDADGLTGGLQIYKTLLLLGNPTNKVNWMDLRCIWGEHLHPFCIQRFKYPCGVRKGRDAKTWPQIRDCGRSRKSHGSVHREPRDSHPDHRSPSINHVPRKSTSTSITQQPCCNTTDPECLHVWTSCDIIPAVLRRMQGVASRSSVSNRLARCNWSPWRSWNIFEIRRSVSNRIARNMQKVWQEKDVRCSRTFECTYDIWWFSIHDISSTDTRMQHHGCVELCLDIIITRFPGQQKWHHANLEGMQRAHKIRDWEMESCSSQILQGSKGRRIHHHIGVSDPSRHRQSLGIVCSLMCWWMRLISRMPNSRWFVSPTMGMMIQIDTDELDIFQIEFTFPAEFHDQRRIKELISSHCWKNMQKWRKISPIVLETILLVDIKVPSDLVRLMTSQRRQEEMSIQRYGKRSWNVSIWKKERRKKRSFRKILFSIIFLPQNDHKSNFVENDEF